MTSNLEGALTRLFSHGPETHQGQESDRLLSTALLRTEPRSELSSAKTASAADPPSAPGWLDRAAALGAHLWDTRMGWRPSRQDAARHGENAAGAVRSRPLPGAMAPESWAPGSWGPGSWAPGSGVLGSLAADLLDQLPYGLFAIDQHRKVLWRNAATEALLRPDSPIALRAGRLVCPSSRHQDLFGERLAAVLDILRAKRPTGGLAVLLEDEPTSPLALMVRGAAHFHDVEPRPISPVLLVFAWRPSSKPTIASEVLEQLYGLTVSEARLASAIGQGTSLEDYARANSIGIGTARWHLKHVHEKIGTRSQSELVRLLLTGPQGFGGPYVD